MLNNIIKQTNWPYLLGDTWSSSDNNLPTAAPSFKHKMTNILFSVT
jgi:hypothetical protein